MMKLVGIDLEGITSERLNSLSKIAVRLIPLSLFNLSLRILNLGSIGELMKSTRDYKSDIKPNDIKDPLEESDKAYRKITQSKNLILFPFRLLRAYSAAMIMLLLFHYINLKFYRFFLDHPKHANLFLANQFYGTIEKLKDRFLFGRFYFRKATELKADHESRDLLFKELKWANTKFHLSLTSEQDLFHRFTERLYEIGAIKEKGYFKEVFNGFVGNQVNWYFDKESIIFMVESMNLKHKIRMTDRSKDISICFFNAKDGVPFDPDDLNTVASRKGLSKFDSQSFQEIIRNPPKNDIPKIYSVYKEIYRS